MSRQNCISLIINSGLVLVSTILSLLAFEQGVRWTMGEKIVLFPRNHSEALYDDFVIRRMVPNMEFWHESVDGRWRFKINKNGFRDEENYTYEKSPGVFRILTLGDSHTVGFEVAQNATFSEQIEDELSRRGIRAEVLNTGISGFGTAEQLIFLENEGLKYNPDAIVIAFFANDYSDNLRSGLFRLINGQLEISAKRYAPAVGVISLTHRIPGLKWLGENSYAYSLIFNKVWNFFKDLSIQRAEREFAVPVGDAGQIEIEMAAALLNRLTESCQKFQILCILADIPTLKGPTGYETSLKPTLINKIKESYPHILTSESYLGSRQVERVFVQHGQRHISTETHKALALALAEKLAAN